MSGLRISSKPTVIVLGSSVALGCHATNNHGWAWCLSLALKQRGWDFHNLSLSGADTASTIKRFHYFFSSSTTSSGSPSTSSPPLPPSQDFRQVIIIIGLSLANEGLLWGDEDAADSFQKGIKQLIELIRKLGAQPLIGGVYPNNDYLNSLQVGLLQKVFQEQTNWNRNFLERKDWENNEIRGGEEAVPVIDFLSTTTDGSGKWRKGLWEDSGHPNNEGHKVMFNAIPLTLFDHFLSHWKQTQENPPHAFPSAPPPSPSRL